MNLTRPAFSTDEPGRDFQEIWRPGTSLTVSASHVISPPARAGAFATHLDRCSSRTVTLLRCVIIFGRRSRLLHSRYSSSAGRLTRVDFAMWIPLGMLGGEGRFPLVFSPNLS